MKRNERARKLLKETPQEVKDKVSDYANKLLLNNVMKRFRFKYSSCDKELVVELEADSLNDAMVYFATRYHLIDEVYSIVELNAS